MDGLSEVEDGTSNATVPIMLLFASSRGVVVVSVLISSIVCDCKNVFMLFGWYGECRRRCWLLLTKVFVVIDRRVGVVKDETNPGVQATASRKLRAATFDIMLPSCCY